MVRFKNRYVTVEVNPADDKRRFHLKSYHLKTAIEDAVEELHGDFGAGAIRAGFSAKYCNEMTRIAIIRVRHGPHQFITTSLPFIRAIGGNEIYLRTLYIGATLQQCYKAILRHQKVELSKLLKGATNEEERKCFEKRAMDLKAVLDFDKPAKPQLKRKSPNE